MYLCESLQKMNQEKQSLTKSLDLNTPQLLQFGAEFDIPRCNDIPTVENVLNNEAISLRPENDQTDDLPELKVPQLNSMAPSVNPKGMGAQVEQLPKYLKKKSDPEPILSHSVLNPISNYIPIFCDCYSAGQPSAIKFSLRIAVGTTKGFVILFDSSQRFLWYHKSVDCETVFAMDFNHNCSRLLVGYKKGTIIMFDSSSNTCKLLQIMNDVLSPYAAVLHLKFTDWSNLIIVNDSAGSVFELTLKRTFWKRSAESKKVFSGYPSKVYCIEPLLFNQLPRHSMNGHVILAMATLSKIIIFVLRPNTELLLSHDIITSRPCLPLLSWQFVETSNSRHQILNPVLVFILNDTIYFYVVKMNEENCLCCCNLRKIKLPYMIIAFSWMNYRTFLTMSSLEKVHLIDICLKDEIEHLDLLNISLIFTSSFCDGSNDQHLDKLYYCSVHSHNGQLIFLSENSVNIIRVKCWTEYLDRLTDQKLYIDALQLGVQFLERKRMPIYDMRCSQAPKPKIVKKKVVDIVTLYIDSLININNRKYYNDGIPIVMDICVYLEKTDMLFNRLWDAVMLIKTSYNMFLECLVSYLYYGQIKVVPTNIIQELFTYLSLRNQFKKLERCIINVKVEYLDIDQSIKLARAHSLHDGLISIWTRAFQDYTTPLQELVPKIVMTNGEYSNFTIKLGNIILNYLSACLLGHAYPIEDYIPNYLKDKVRTNIVQFLCSLHSIKAKDDEYIYPYLRTLLEFNTTTFLNILRNPDCCISNQQKQRIICILSSFITSDKKLKSNQLGYIYAFIVEWQKNENNSIKLDKSILATVIELLTSSDQTTPLKVREKIFFHLKSLGEFNNNPNLLKIAEEAKFYSVCKQICSERGDFSKIFKYYKLDDSKKHQVFRFIKSKPECLEQLTDDNVKILMDIDTVKFGMIFDKFYQQRVCNISEQMKINYQKYLFWKNAIDVNSNVRLCPSSFENLCRRYEPSTEKNFEERNSLQLAKSQTAAKILKLDNVSNVLLERFINCEEGYEFLLTQLQKCIQQEYAVEEYMKIQFSPTQRGSFVVGSKSSWLSMIQFLISLQSHDRLKEVLDSKNHKLSPEMQSLMSSPKGTIDSFKNLMMGIVYNRQYECQLFKSSEIIDHDDLCNPMAEEINGDQHCSINPGICSSHKHKYNILPMIIFRCGHRFHSDCLGVHTACTICSPTINDM